MKNFLLRTSLALIATMGVAALSAQAQDQQPATSTPSATQQQPSASSPTATPSQNDMAQSQDAAKPFSGTIVKEKGKYVLKDTATNMSYQLDDQDKAKQYEGKQVKVTGKLDASSNQIKVESIEGPTS